MVDGARARRCDSQHWEAEIATPGDCSYIPGGLGRSGNWVWDGPCAELGANSKSWAGPGSILPVPAQRSSNRPVGDAPFAFSAPLQQTSQFLRHIGEDVSGRHDVEPERERIEQVQEFVELVLISLERGFARR